MGDQGALTRTHPGEALELGAGGEPLAPGFLVPKPVAPSPLAEDFGGRAPRVDYDEMVAERICELYSSGMKLAQIGQMDDCPSYQTLLRWVKLYPSFREKLEGCEVARALYYRDRALDAAEAATDPETVPAERLRFDAFKWAAETADPSKFGKKTVVSGDQTRPIRFVIETGVPAPETPATELTADGLVKEVVSEVVDAAPLEQGETSPD